MSGNGSGNGNGRVHINGNGKDYPHTSNEAWAEPPPFDPWDRTEVEMFGDEGKGSEPSPQPNYDPLVLIAPSSWIGKPVPELRWLVPDWVPWGRVTAIYGHGATGKTLMCQQLMTCCAIGAKWMNFTTVKLRSIGFFCEDDEAEIHRRQEQINKAYGCSMEDVDQGVRYIARLGLDNILMRYANSRGVRSPLVDDLIKEALKFGAELVVIDTVSDTFDGNEISRPEVRQYVSTLGYIAQAIGGTVVCTAHPSREGMRSGTGESGSTQFFNSFRSMIYGTTVGKPGDDNYDPNLRNWRRVKSNYAVHNASFDTKWERGAFLPTGPNGPMERKAAQSMLDMLVLELVALHQDAGSYVFSTSQSPRYAPTVFATHERNIHHASRRDFTDAMNRMLRAGKLRNDRNVAAAGRRQKFPLYCSL